MERFWLEDDPSTLQGAAAAQSFQGEERPHGRNCRNRRGPVVKKVSQVRQEQGLEPLEESVQAREQGLELMGPQRSLPHLGNCAPKITIFSCHSCLGTVVTDCFAGSERFCMREVGQGNFTSDEATDPTCCVGNGWRMPLQTLIEIHNPYVRGLTHLFGASLCIALGGVFFTVAQTAGNVGLQICLYASAILSVMAMVCKVW